MSVLHWFVSSPSGNREAAIDITILDSLPRKRPVHGIWRPCILSLSDVTVSQIRLPTFSNPLVRKKSSGRTIGARLGPLYVYFIFGAKNIQRIFRSSKSLSSNFLVLAVYRNVIGIPKRDLAIYEADTSGSFAAPLSNVPEEKRIWRKLHEIQHHYLSTSNHLNVLTCVFTAEFKRIIDEIPLNE